MSALEFTNISHEFGTPDGRTYCAVRDVSFAVPAGRFLAIVGPSGCGKSTLLNIAAGLMTPSSGQVTVDDRPLDGVNRRATYMFQQDALLPWKTVRENVALGLVLAGMPRADANIRADGWLTKVGLAGFGRHFPSQLSGGMRKRVAVAQNWIIDRDILLMDEPFSALDLHTRQRMESELLALWEELRRTVILVTHDLEEAIALADEVLVLSAGPASRVIARHPVTLPRPRDILDLRTESTFVELYRAIWADLREQVISSQRQAEARRA
jgi:NitT/TauT family transport system ATP-binding protein